MTFSHCAKRVYHLLTSDSINSIESSSKNALSRSDADIVIVWMELLLSVEA